MKNSIFKKLFQLGCLVTVLVITFSVACKKKDEEEKPGTNEVWMQSNAFNPTTITVAHHSTITWTNKDNTSHTASSDSTFFDSPTLNNAGTYQHTFDSAGTFHYHCNFHSGMTGTVVVQ